MPSDVQTAPHRTDRLLALLERQKFLVEQLGALASRQETAVRDENAEALLELLGKRQELIDRVMSAQGEIAMLLPHGAEATIRPEMPSEERQRAAKLIEEIEQGLAEVMKRDDEARSIIRSIQDRGRSDIRAFGRTQQARRAYAPQLGSRSTDMMSPRFSDSKG
jgi:hypothetical protein